ncbi:MAG TPA: hypothetical protein VKJ45_17260 [Blastocatellia bacterium]|nr:hypothetical protein [Blastocatellia bacterium]
MKRLSKAIGVRRLAVGAIGLLLCIAFAPIVRPKTESLSQGLTRIQVAGLTSAENNVAFALGGRFAVVAPFAPSSSDDSAPLDNHYLYLVDTQGSHDVTLCDLDDPVTGASRIYPTHLIVSSDNFAFVRATSIDQRTEKPTEGIAFAQINADQNGKISAPFQYGGFFPITPVGATDPALMPTSFGLSNNGQYVCFTDGAQVLIADRILGNTYTIPIVTDYVPMPPDDDGTPDFYSITSVNVDSTNVVSVTVNGRRNGQNFSQLYFYLLLESGKHAGTVKSLAIVKSDSLPLNVGITPESIPAISPDGSLGFFSTDDGSVFSVALSGSANLKLNSLGTYVSVSVLNGTAVPGPRIVQYDADSKRLSVIRQGRVPRVRRPSFIRHGKTVRRPSFIRLVEQPGAAVIQLNAQTQFVSSQEAQYFGVDVDSISNTAWSGVGGSYFVASVGGKTGVLMAFDKSGPQLFGSALPNIKQVMSPDASTILGMQDFDFDSGASEPATITAPGGLVFMSVGHSVEMLGGAASYQANIRRPCNYKH